MNPHLKTTPSKHGAHPAAPAWVLRTLADVMLSSLGLSAAHADGSRMPAKILPSYTAECAACHTAYPPGMLPARSWQRTMKGLDHHYGSDASLDAKTVTEIGQWLQTHAGTYKRVAEEPPQDRLTRSA